MKGRRNGGVFKDHLLNVNCLRNSTFSLRTNKVLNTRDGLDRFVRSKDLQRIYHLVDKRLYAIFNSILFSSILFPLKSNVFYFFQDVIF